MQEGRYAKLFRKQIYCLCGLLICDGSWSLVLLGGAFLGTGIQTYFKLYWKWKAAAVIPQLLAV